MRERGKIAVRVELGGKRGARVWQFRRKSRDHMGSRDFQLNQRSQYRGSYTWCCLLTLRLYIQAAARLLTVANDPTR